MKRALSWFRGFDGDAIAAVPTDVLTPGRACNAGGSEVHPLDVLPGSSIERDPHRSVGDFAATVILGRRRQRSGFAGAGDRHPRAHDDARQG
ncbi:hypothetical protein DPR02_30065 [Burkholderia cepacia]|uniref:Uncharacterized protein n=1 Tax=Burkholderia cepacia TaxID=292 RepID=A0AAQ0F7N4_BURCE|nr:hypothetical protein [Burkholderia cepacia]RAQ03318.1 hypothetical protein DPR02_30065 [Burkholderia cepacia]